MSLTEACFCTEFLDKICGHFGKNLSVAESSIYFRKFSVYSDETFIELCDEAFDLEFFPSVNWYKKQYSELSERSQPATPICLSSSEMKELENMTVEECHQNFRRLKALMNGVARMPLIRKQKLQPDRAPEIPQDFRIWLEKQFVIMNAPQDDRASLLRIMSVSDRLRSEFLQQRAGEDF